MGVFSIAILALASLSSTTNAESILNNKAPPARDGNVAIEQELCAARIAGTVESYELFIARHPDHPLARIAKRERDALRKARD